ncbi:hypothetical protein AB0F42_09395 [Streptomyces buecherae]|uniref:hypothetical protein n=1 Tax=Streptomyces buecherae TaxID=2763006 RepID=UPI0033EF94DB
MALLISSGVWWVVTKYASDDNAIHIPPRVCDERISGESVSALLPKEGADFKEETRDLKQIRGHGECTLQAGGEDAFFSYIYVPGSTYPRDRVQLHGVPISLGEAYGYMAANHAMLLYVPCAGQKTTDRMLVKASSSLADQEANNSRDRAKPVTGDAKVAAFAADVARDLARNWINCPNADKLPEGPVKIHWP